MQTSISEDCVSRMNDRKIYLFLVMPHVVAIELGAHLTMFRSRVTRRCDVMTRGVDVAFT